MTQPAEKIVWQSPCLDCETVRDGAERFVREFFGADRRIRWGDSVGEFRFADGFHCYRITAEAGHWYVRRMEKLTPRGKEYSKARRKGAKPNYPS